MDETLKKTDQLTRYYKTVFLIGQDLLKYK